MPRLDRIPRADIRTRRAFDGIGSDFVPYVGAIKDVDLGVYTLTATGIILTDGGTVGQAAGPLLTFNDTDNFLGITGCHVGIGPQAATDFATTDLHLTGTNSTQLRTTRYSSSGGGGTNVKMRRARGTASVPVYVTNGDRVTYLDSYGWARNEADTADAWIQLGQIEMYVDGVDAQDRIGGQFQVTLSPGTSMNAEPVFRIDADGSADLFSGSLTTTGLGTFGSLDVDTLNLNGNAITDSTGAISFGDETLTTTGLITGSAINLTDATNAIRVNGAKVFGTPGTENLFLGPNITGSITGDRNTLVGSYAGYSLTTGSSNTLLGRAAGISIVGASDNVCIGRDAGRNLTTGGRGVYIGTYAGYAMPTSSQRNICIGYTAGWGVAGNVTSSNVFIGYESGYSIRTGQYDIGLGDQALKYITTGNRNIALGQQAGYGQSTGSDNLYLGTQAGAVAHTYSGTLILGHYANATANNQMVVGSVTSAITDIYIGEGVTSASPQDLTFNASGGSGTDIAAGDLLIQGGVSTGNADPGDIIFKTTDAGASSTTPQTLASRMTISDTAVTMHTGLVIPSGITPAPAVEGALFLDTDAGANGTLVCYSNGAWRTVQAF